MKGLCKGLQLWLLIRTIMLPLSSSDFLNFSNSNSPSYKTQKHYIIYTFFSFKRLKSLKIYAYMSVVLGFNWSRFLFIKSLVKLLSNSLNPSLLQTRNTNLEKELKKKWYLKMTARKKVMAGTKFLIADASVGEL